MSQNQAQPQGEAPKYKLEECAYINDVMYEKDAVIEWQGVPGWHMTPVNKPAHVMKEKHPSERPDPIEEMTSLKASDASLGDLATIMAKAMAEAMKQVKN